MTPRHRSGAARKAKAKQHQANNNEQQPCPSREVSTQNGTTACEEEDAATFGEVSKDMNMEKAQQTPQDKRADDTLEETLDAKGLHTAQEKAEENTQAKEQQNEQEEKTEDSPNDEINAKAEKSADEQEAKTANDEKDNKTANDEQEGKTANNDENAKSETPADEKDSKTANDEFAKSEKPADEQKDKTANDEKDGKTATNEKESKRENFGDEQESKTNVKGVDEDETEMANANLLEDKKAEEKDDEPQEQEAEKVEEEREKFVAAEVVVEKKEEETKMTNGHNARDEQEVGIHPKETDQRHEEVQQAMAAAEEQKQEQEKEKHEDEVQVTEEKQEIQIEESSESLPEWAASEAEFSVAPSEESTGFCCVKDITGNVCEELFVSGDGLCGPRERSRVFNEARHVVLGRIPAAIVRYAEEAQSESVADACLSCSNDMSESCFPATKLFAEMILASGAAAMSFLYQYRKEIAKGVACLAANTFKCFKTCLCTVTPPPQEARAVQRGASGRWIAVDYPADQWSPRECAEVTVLPNVHFPQSAQPASGMPQTPSLCPQASVEVLEQQPPHQTLQQQPPHQTLQQQLPQQTLQQHFCAVSPGPKHAPFMRRVPSNH